MVIGFALVFPKTNHSTAPTPSPKLGTGLREVKVFLVKFDHCNDFSDWRDRYDR